MLPFMAFASWENVALKYFDVVMSSKARDYEAFKDSLCSLSDKINTELKDYDTDRGEFSLNLPPNLESLATDKKSKIHLEILRYILTNRLKKETDSITNVIKSKINAMDKTNVNEIMSGKVLFGDYLQEEGNEDLRAVILPAISSLSSNSQFVDSYRKLTGENLAANFEAKFTDDLLESAFIYLKSAERDFRRNTDKIFDTLGAIK